MVDKGSGKVATDRKPLSTVNSNTCVPSNGGDTYACLLRKGEAEVVDDFISINDGLLEFNSKSKDKIKLSGLITGLGQPKVDKGKKDSANSLLQSRCKQTARKKSGGLVRGSLGLPPRGAAPRGSSTLKSRLATLNVCVWDEATWMVVRQWMQEAHIDALAIQEARLTSLALDPVGGDDLFESFMGPTGKGISGMEAGGVGWVFRKTWADKAGLKKVAKAERVVTVSVDTTGGTLDLHSIYSQSHGDVALGGLREGVWFGDVNDNAPLAREAWKSSFRSLGNRLVLNRIGGFAECPTRFPRGTKRVLPRTLTSLP